MPFLQTLVLLAFMFYASSVGQGRIAVDAYRVVFKPAPGNRFHRTGKVPTDLFVKFLAAMLMLTNRMRLSAALQLRTSKTNGLLQFREVALSEVLEKLVLGSGEMDLLLRRWLCCVR